MESKATAMNLNYKSEYGSEIILADIKAVTYHQDLKYLKLQTEGSILMYLVLL
jgi:hypothetical protein